MGDMGDLFREEKEEFRIRCEKRNNRFEPLLIALGAVKKSDAVYDLDGYLCYPTKGFAMNKRNSNDRCNLAKFIEKRTKNGTK